MSDYLIKGGKRLKGSIAVNPSKNGAIAVLVASLLNEKPTIIKNLPKIEEIFRLIEVLKSIGVAVEWFDKNNDFGGHNIKITPPKTIEKIFPHLFLKMFYIKKPNQKFPKFLHNISIISKNSNNSLWIT